MIRKRSEKGSIHTCLVFHDIDNFLLLVLQRPYNAVTYEIRLILASAQLGDGNGLSSNAIEIHLTLSRALVLQGAFDEAKAHAHAAEELMPVEGRGRGIGGGSGFNTDSIDISALHLEIALLSRTPVVTESWDQVTSLREGLLGELDRLGKENSFRYSISRPLEVGVRAQFLATYQVRRDQRQL